jgi:hypothetical protein
VTGWDGHEIADLDFGDYRGLPSDCSVADVLARFPPIAERPGSGTMGRSGRPAGFWLVATEVAAAPLRVWFDGDLVQRIDVEFPRPFDWLGQTRSLGEPDSVEDYDFGGVVLPDSALVWALRGISVLSNPERSAVTSVLLYHPCDLGAYHRDVFFSQPPRERPLDPDA